MSFGIISFVILMSLMFFVFRIGKNSQLRMIRFFLGDKNLLVCAFKFLAIQVLLVSIAGFFLNILYYFWFYDFKSDAELMFLLILTWSSNITVFVTALIISLYIFYKNINKEDAVRFSGVLASLVFGQFLIGYLLLGSLLSKIKEEIPGLNEQSIVSLIVYPLLSYVVVYYFLRKKLK